MALERSERLCIAAGDIQFNLHRHDGEHDGVNTHTLGVSSFGTTFISFDVHLTRADMLALADALKSVCDGPATQETIDRVVVVPSPEAVAS
jgi:hypothetical protein